MRKQADVQTTLKALDRRCPHAIAALILPTPGDEGAQIRMQSVEMDCSMFIETDLSALEQALQRAGVVLQQDSDSRPQILDLSVRHGLHPALADDVSVRRHFSFAPALLVLSSGDISRPREWRPLPPNRQATRSREAKGAGRETRWP